MPRKYRLTVAFLAALAISQFAFADAASLKAFVGTWTMNPSKSKFIGPPLMSYRAAITDAGGGMVHTVLRWVAAGDIQGQIEYTVDPSGKATAVIGSSNIDTVRVESATPHSFRLIFLKGGKVSITGEYTLAANGKSMHSVESGTDSRGQKFTGDVIFDRQ